MPEETLCPLCKGKLFSIDTGTVFCEDCDWSAACFPIIEDIPVELAEEDKTENEETPDDLTTVPIRYPKSYIEELKAHAASLNMSLRGWVKETLDSAMILSSEEDMSTMENEEKTENLQSLEVDPDTKEEHVNIVVLPTVDNVDPAKTSWWGKLFGTTGGTDNAGRE